MAHKKQQILSTEPSELLPQKKPAKPVMPWKDERPDQLCAVGCASFHDMTGLRTQQEAQRISAWHGWITCLWEPRHLQPMSTVRGGSPMRGIISCRRPYNSKTPTTTW